MHPRITVTHLAGIFAVGIVIFGASALANARPLLAAQMPLATTLTIPFAVGAWLVGGVSLSGAIAGAGVSIAIFAGCGWPGWLLLVGVFVVTTGATRIGHARKTAAGISESRQGRRAVGNVVANTGIAAAAALFAPGAGSMATLVVAAALVTAACDSVSSEIGKAYGGRTYLVPTGRRVLPGTNGAISAAGTMAGSLSALGLAYGSAWLGLIPPGLPWIVAAAAVFASLLEGAIGTTFEDPGWLDNNGVNFLNTLAGAGLALTGARLLALA